MEGPRHEGAALLDPPLSLYSKRKPADPAMPPRDTWVPRGSGKGQKGQKGHKGRGRGAGRVFQGHAATRTGESQFASASTPRRDATWPIANSNMFAVIASTQVTTSSLARSASRRTLRGSTDSAPTAVSLFMGASFGFFICFVASHVSSHWKPT